MVLTGRTRHLKELDVAVLPRDLAGDDTVLTDEDFDLLLDERCRRWLDMSLHEFLAARAAGALPDSPAADQLDMLARVRTG